MSKLCKRLFYFSGSTETSETKHDTAPLNRVRRGGLSMLRLGRGLQMLRLGKRAMPMLRLGRGVESYSPEDIRAIINTLFGKDRSGRQVPLPRYGKDAEIQMLLERLLSDPQNEERRSMDLYDTDDESPRLINPGPRPGYRYRRSVPDVPPQSTFDSKLSKQVAFDNDNDHFDIKDSQERTVPLPRFGRYLTVDEYLNQDMDEEKRAMPMLRLGRAMSMLRLGKRAMNMLRLGRSNGSADDDVAKRAMPMLRLGKRPFKMLRLGKRFDDAEEPEIKRNLRMMRLGRGGDKRAMPMLRLGRSQ